MLKRKSIGNRQQYLVVAGFVLLAACSNIFQPKDLSDHYNPMDPDHYSPPVITLPGIPEDGGIMTTRKIPFAFTGDWVSLTQYRWRFGLTENESAWSNWALGGTRVDTSGRYNGVLDSLYLDETYANETFLVEIQAKYINEDAPSDSLTRTFTVDAIQTPAAVIRPQTIFTHPGEEFSFELCFDSMPAWTAAQLRLNYDTTFVAITEVDTLSGSNTLVVYNLGNITVELNVGNYGDADPRVLKFHGQASTIPGITALQMTHTRFMDGPTPGDTLHVSKTRTNIIIQPAE